MHTGGFPKCTGYKNLDFELAQGLNPRLFRILHGAQDIRSNKKLSGVIELAHAHIDRSLIDSNKYIKQGNFDPSIMDLVEKQSATENMAEIAYTPDSIKQRVSHVLNIYCDYGVGDFTSFANIGENLSQDGMGVLNTLIELKKQYAHKINFNILSYPMFGFREDKPERWKLFESSMDIDGINGMGTLPERDDVEHHIGYKANIERTIKLALERQTPIHIHVDQANTPNEDGTEQIMEVISSIEEIYSHDILYKYINPSNNQPEPIIWLVHAISPSCYDNERFQKLVDRVSKYNIGLIVCPSAAISMKQESQYSSPVHNSIARVIDFLKAGVHVKMGIDNIGDIYLPMTGNPLYEVRLLADAIRLYDEDILAHVISGQRLPDDLIDKLREKY